MVGCCSLLTVLLTTYYYAPCFFRWAAAPYNLPTLPTHPLAHSPTHQLSNLHRWAAARCAWSM
eukprot:scaffold63530_cov33-Phaeocystis_antarctica.AAC.1